MDERVRDLSKLIVDTSPQIILRQEIVCPDTLAIETVATIILGWELVVSSAMGISGGLLSR